MKINNYFIYDGLAHHDVDSACMIECFTAKSQQEAREYHDSNYEGMDTVLFDFDNEIVY